MKQLFPFRIFIVFILSLFYCGNALSAIVPGSGSVTSPDMCEGNDMYVFVGGFVSDETLQYRFSVDDIVIQNFSHNSTFIYPTPKSGSYPVKVVLREDITNDSLELFLTVQIYPRPVLNPTFPATTVCAPNTVDIYQPSSPSITYWGEYLATPIPDPSSIAITGIYYLLETNAYGCQDTFSVDVTINEKPVFTPVSSVITACVSADITQPADPGFSFTYYESDLATIVPDPANVTVSDTYYITKTDDNTGCISDTMSVVVTIYDKPFFTPASSIVTACVSADIIQPADPGFTFTYYESDQVNIVPDPSVITTNDTYYITKTDDATTCVSDLQPVVVTIDDKPRFIPDSPAVTECVSASIVQSADPGFTFTYYESDQVTIVADPSAITVSDTYYITKTDDATTCVSDPQPVVVTIHGKPVFIPTDPAAVCYPNTVSIEQPVDPGFFFLYYEDAAGTIPLPHPANISISGTYYITKTNDITRCVSDTMPVAVTIHALPVAFAGADRTICDNLTTQLGEAPRPGFTYLWTPNLNITGGDPTVADPTIIPDETIPEYVVTVTETATGCSSRDTVSITALRAPVIYDLSGGGFYCAGEYPDTTFVRLSNSETGVTYTLYDNGVMVSQKVGTTGTPLVWNNLPQGDYTMDAVNPTGCQSNMKGGPITVTEVAKPTARITVAKSPICTGESTEITIKFTGVAPFSATYQTAPGMPVFITSPTDTYKFTVSPTETTTWSVTHVGDFHCQTIYAAAQRPGVTVTVGAVIDATITTIVPGDYTCAGYPITLTPATQDPSLTYTWSTGATTITTIVSPTQTSKYYLEIKDSIGCFKRDSIVINVHPLPVVDFTGPNLFTGTCVNSDPIPLTGSPTGGIFSGPNVVGYTYYPQSNAGQDNITYTYTDMNGCENSITKTITVSAVPAVDWYVPEELGPPTEYLPSYTFCRFPNDSIALQGVPKTNNISYWTLFKDPGNPANLITLPNGQAYIENAYPGTFEVEYTYTDNKGCTNSKRKEIVISSDYQEDIDMGELVISAGDTICRTETSVLIKAEQVNGWFQVSNPAMIVSQDTTIGELWINPSLVPAGKYRVIYRLTDILGCSNNHYIYKDFYIQSPINVNPLTIPKEYCVNADPVTFTFKSAKPVFGYVSIVKNTNDSIRNRIPADTQTPITFDPSWGVGSYEIVFEYSDKYCSNIYKYKVSVLDIPVIDMNLVRRDYCFGDVITLNALPASGQYTSSNGNVGLTNNRFDTNKSSTGTFTIYYRYEDSNGCANNDSIEIYVRGQKTGDMNILNLNPMYCENKGIVNISAHPTVNGVPYFKETVYLKDLGNGNAEIDLSKTNYNSTNPVTFYFKEYYQDVNGVPDSCINSVSQSFKIIGESPSFSGFNDKDTICGHISSLMLNGNVKTNYRFEINTPTGAEITNLTNGQATLHPDQLTEGWYTVTYTVDSYQNGVFICSAEQVKTFYLLPITPFEPRIVCSGNQNAFVIDATDIGTTYEMWVNGVLYESFPGTGGAIAFTPLNGDALCVFYAQREQCRVEYPTKFQVAPLTVSISKTAEISCFGADDGVLTAVVKGGLAPTSVSWSGTSASDFSSDITVANLSPDTYTVLVTDSIGCTQTASATLVEPDLLQLSIGSQSDTLCHNASNGFAQVIATGGRTPYVYRWLDENNNTISSSGSISNVKAGIYRAYVTDHSNCTDMVTVEIDEYPAITFSVDYLQHVAIYGDATGEVDITVGGGLPPYAYLWTGLGIDPLNQHNEDQTGLIAGKYFIIITDDNACILDTSVVITQPEKLIVTEVITDVSCFGYTDGQIDLTVMGGTKPYTFDWSQGGISFASTEDLINLPAGIYSVIITDAEGDTFSQNYEVKSPDLLYVYTKGLTNLSILCHGETTGALDVEGRDGTAPYTYLWSGIGVPPADVNKPYIDNLPAGTYQIEITDAHNCVATEDYLIIQPSQLGMTSVVTNPSCYDSFDAAIDVTVTGGVAPYTYYWSGNYVIPTDEDQTLIQAGTYVVTVTDANACTLIDTIIIANPTELNISLSGTPHVCIGTDAQLHFAMNEDRQWTIDYTDGTSTYTINPTLANAYANHSITQNTTFSIIQAYDQNGCFATIGNKDVTVIVHDYPDITLLTNHIEVCLGEDVYIPFTLSGEAPWSVLFTDGTNNYSKSGIPLGVDSLFLFPTTSQTYSLVSVSTDYCTTYNLGGAPVTVDVVVHPLSQLTAVCNNPVICSGATTTIDLTLQGEAPWTVYYTEGSIEKSVLVASSPYLLAVDPIVTTKYRFHTVESAFGCKSPMQTEIIITISPLPDNALTITGPDEVCDGATLTYFTPYIANATQYDWTLPPGATIQNGINTNQILVKFGPGAQSGNFSVQGRNACGTGQPVSMAVLVNPLPDDASSIIVPNVICQGERNFYISSPEITNATEYVWSLPYGFIVQSGQGTKDLLVSLAEDAVAGTISVFGKNACGTGAAFQQAVSISAFPAVEAGPNAYTNCNDYINMNALPATPNTGTWKVVQGKGTFQNVNDPKTLVTDIGLGDNLYVWEVSSSICTKTDTVRITNYSTDKAVPEITGNYILCDETLVIRANSPLNGTGKWDCVSGSANIQDPYSNETVASGFRYGLNQLRWTISNGTCENFALVNIYYYSAKEHAFAGNDTTVYVPQCNLNAAGILADMTGVWQRIGGTGVIVDSTSNKTLVTNLSPGMNTFRWVVKTPYCKPSHSEVRVMYIAGPVALFKLDTLENCSPFTPVITNETVGLGDFFWDFGDGATANVRNPSHTYTEPGEYIMTLKVTGNEGSVTQYSQTITVRRSPDIRVEILQETLYIPNANLLMLNGTTGATKFFWDFGTGDYSTDKDPVYRYTEAGVYDIKMRATGQHGCVDSIRIKNAVYVRSDGFITFPNAFIPNKGYSNGGVFSLNERNHDVFYPIWDDVAEYKIEIFNRWGEKIFESKDINVGWDGYVNGKLSPVGIYVYKATGKFNNGEAFTRKGEITLVQ